MQPKNWAPTEPVSKGALGYHNAVISASWNNDNLYEFIPFLQRAIRENDVVVDFGAGTGASAVRYLERLGTKIKLLLVDNSPAWLAKAHELLKDRSDVDFFILERKEEGYAGLDEVIGKNKADAVVSANTFHLVPDLKSTFSGIANALKPERPFLFQSGNIQRNSRPEGILLIEDTIHRTHDIALEIIRNEQMFEVYRRNLDEQINMQEPQRRKIFPDPRDISLYLDALKQTGFEHEAPVYKVIKVRYPDWMDFLRVKRLQAGILPEIGGRYPNEEEELDRNSAIVMAANRLFDELRANNPFADEEGFCVEWAYVRAVKKP